MDLMVKVDHGRCKQLALFTTVCHNFLADELGNFQVGTMASHSFNSLSAKKKMTKFTSANFHKMSGPS